MRGRTVRLSCPDSSPDCQLSGGVPGLVRHQHRQAAAQHGLEPRHQEGAGPVRSVQTAAGGASQV